MQKTKYDGIYKIKEGVLLNMDNEALQQYKLSKQKAKRLNQVEQDVSDLKAGMERIEKLLMRALEK